MGKVSNQPRLYEQTVESVPPCYHRDIIVIERFKYIYFLAPKIFFRSKDSPPLHRYTHRIICIIISRLRHLPVAGEALLVRLLFLLRLGSALVISHEKEEGQGRRTAAAVVERQPAGHIKGQALQTHARSRPFPHSRTNALPRVCTLCARAPTQARPHTLPFPCRRVRGCHPRTHTLLCPHLLKYPTLLESIPQTHTCPHPHPHSRTNALPRARALIARAPMQARPRTLPFPCHRVRSCHPQTCSPVIAFGAAILEHTHLPAPTHPTLKQSTAKPRDAHTPAPAPTLAQKCPAMRVHALCPRTHTRTSTHPPVSRFLVIAFGAARWAHSGSRKLLFHMISPLLTYSPRISCDISCRRLNYRGYRCRLSDTGIIDEVQFLTPPPAHKPIDGPDKNTS